MLITGLIMNSFSLSNLTQTYENVSANFQLRYKKYGGETKFQLDNTYGQYIVN
ncbi:hypothetical protein CEXT_187791, partial [Caerostris extrusa]